MTATVRRVLGPVLVMVLVAGGVLVGGATAAQAHAELLNTDPKVGETLRQTPGDVTFTFSEPMLALGAVVQVVGPGGAAEKGKASVSARTVTQPLGKVENGSYIVTWRLTAQDGHVQGGTFTFLVADPARPRSTAGIGTPPAGEEPPTPAATTSAAAEPTPSPIIRTTQATAPTNQDDGDSLPLGWVILGVLVLAAVVAGVMITVVRRRPTGPGASPQEPSSD